MNLQTVERARFRTALVMSMIIALPATCCHAIPINVVNPSFDDASNFNFTSNPNNIPVVVGDLGNWVFRGANEDEQMDIADTTAVAFGSLTGQTGATAVLLQATADRGLLQFFDVTGLGDTTGLDMSLSFDIAAPGTTLGASVELYGFSSFTGLTVDLGGASTFTGGTFSTLASVSYVDGDLSDTAFETMTLNTGPLAADFEYIAVILGGNAGADNNDLQYVAFDNIQLDGFAPPPVVPEPSTSLLLVLGTLVLTRHSRRHRNKR
jgi:hypothetical protein